MLLFRISPSFLLPIIFFPCLTISQVGKVVEIQLSQATNAVAWLAFQSSINYTQILPNQQVLNSDGLSFNNLNWFSVTVGGAHFDVTFAVLKTQGPLRWVWYLNLRVWLSTQAFMHVPYDDTWIVRRQEAEIVWTTRNPQMLLAFCCVGGNPHTGRRM